MITVSPAADAATVAAHYDDLDEFYRSVWGNHLHHGCWISGEETTAEAVLNLTRLIARAAEILPGHRVCDLGCGYGASALLFAREYEAAVVGLTISRKQYEIARDAAAATPQVEFLLRDVLENRLTAESFDSIVAIESSEHIQNKAALFSEAFRLLRPGGRLAITAWLSSDQPRTWESKYLLEPICAEGRLPSLLTAEEYRALVAKAGFINIQFDDLTRQVQRTWRICALRMVGKVMSKSNLRRRLLDPGFSNRVFAKTVLRIWLAYKTASMRYGIFSALKTPR
jgi:tocopherol O-methyltransferase